MSAPAPSKLDFEQCIQGAFDDTLGEFRVDATVTSTGTDREQIAAADDANKAFTYTLVSGAYRLDSIAYTSATVLPGHTATKSFTWADFGTATERITSIIWTYV